MKYLKLVLLVVLIFGLSEFVQAEIGDVKFNGLVQTWYSIGQQDTLDSYASDYTLRRIRLKASGSLSENVDWYCQYYWDKQLTGLIDAAMVVKFSKVVNLKIGQFVAPGAKSHALTSSGKLDFIERSAVVQKWAGNVKLTGGRNVGFQLFGKFMKNKISYAVMVANSHATTLYTPSLKSYNIRGAYKSPAFFGRLEAKPRKCLATGVFLTHWKNSDTDDKILSYGANIFFTKDKIKVKTEYIAGTTEAGIDYSGLMTMFGYRVNKFEPAIRYDIFAPANGDADKYGVENYSNITLGLNFYYQKKVKFQANYVLKQEDTSSIDNNLFYINAQFSI